MPTVELPGDRTGRDSHARTAQAGGRRSLAQAFLAGAAIGVLGGLLLGAVPALVLIPLLVALLIASAWKVWHHR